MKRIWTWRYFKWPSLTLGAAILTVVGTSGDPFVVDVAISLALLFMLPIAILAVLQICFWGYQWAKHGHPFHEDTEPYVYKIVKEKKQKAWCIICKDHSGCRVRKSGAGFLVHVIR